MKIKTFIFFNLLNQNIMANKLFKSIFAVAMLLGSALGFVACEEDVNVVADPTVEVSATSLNFAMEEGGETPEPEPTPEPGDVFVITFPGNPSKYTNSYTDSFTIEVGSNAFVFSGINNGQESNAWTAVRFGRKANDSVATIATSNAISYAVSSVKINFTQVDTEMNSAKLIVASDSDFTNVVEEVTAELAVGEVVYTVTSPAENLYYKLEYDMPLTGTNGSYRFDKITYAK
jgi:hypothetical protein